MDHGALALCNSYFFWIVNSMPNKKVVWISQHQNCRGLPKLRLFLVVQRCHFLRTYPCESQNHCVGKGWQWLLVTREESGDLFDFQLERNFEFLLNLKNEVQSLSYLGSRQFRKRTLESTPRSLRRDLDVLVSKVVKTMFPPFFVLVSKKRLVFDRSNLT